jgi:hypothetical protein
VNASTRAIEFGVSARWPLICARAISSGCRVNKRNLASLARLYSVRQFSHGGTSSRAFAVSLDRCAVLIPNAAGGRRLSSRSRLKFAGPSRAIHTSRQETNVFVQNLESSRIVEDSRSPVDRLGDLWCTLMHDSMSWPIHGHYTCLTCGRQHLVRWEREAFTSPEALTNAGFPAFAEHLSSPPPALPESTTASTPVQ